MVVKYSLNLSDRIAMSFCFEDDNFHDDVCYAVYIFDYGFSFDATVDERKEEVRKYLDSKGLKYND